MIDDFDPNDAPTCARCKKKVDRVKHVVQTDLFEPGSLHIFEIQCHGEREIVKFRSEDIPPGGEINWAPAFEDKTKKLAP